jgi:hypothetical protein
LFLLRIIGVTALFLALLLTPAARAGGEPMIVQEENGWVAGSIRATPLNEVLQAFSNATGVEIVVTGTASELITVDFDPLPPEEAIRSILGERGSIGFYENEDNADNPATRKLTEVWVFKGVARPVKIAPATQTRTSRAERSDPFEALKRQALTGKDPTQRMRAVASLIETDDERAKPALVQALLNDKDAKVRQAALEGLLWYDEEAPRQALIKAALRDESVEIRRQAIEEAFVDQAEDDEGARRILVQAMRDEDATLRLSVLEALANIAVYDENDAAVRRAIAGAMQDQEESIRLVVIESLEDNEMRSELEKAANNDSSAQVREAARQALERVSTASE